MIELQHLSKQFGGGSGLTSVQALDDLCLSVPEGCLFGLLGPNGAGKTTALRILCTLLAPDAGSVTVAGLDVLSEPRAVRRLLGYVAQEVAIDKILSGRELLTLQGDLYHLAAAERHQQCKTLSRRFGLLFVQPLYLLCLL